MIIRMSHQNLTRKNTNEVKRVQDFLNDPITRIVLLKTLQVKLSRTKSEWRKNWAHHILFCMFPLCKYDYAFFNTLIIDILIITFQYYILILM